MYVSVYESECIMLSKGNLIKSNFILNYSPACICLRRRVIDGDGCAREEEIKEKMFVPQGFRLMYVAPQETPAVDEEDDTEILLAKLPNVLAHDSIIVSFPRVLISMDVVFVVCFG